MLRSKVQMIYLEPTPYIEALVSACKERWDGEIDVIYISQNLSQPWHIDSGNATLLSELGPRALPAIVRMIFKGANHKILHLAGWGQRYLALSIVIAKLIGIPTFVESDSSKSQANSLVRKLIKGAIYPVLLRLPTLFLPGGNRQLKYLSSLGVPDHKMTVAQMTSDVAAIKKFKALRGDEAYRNFRQKHDISNDAKIILFLARIEEYKGVFDLITAFQDDIGYENTYLVIVGNGSRLADAQAVAANDPRIVFTGRLSGTDVWSAFCAADIFVIPSHIEPWGLTVNEAMAAGLPVVATDQVGAIDDLVVHMETGIVTPAQEPIALANALKTILDDAELSKKMGDAGSNLIDSWTIENEAAIIVSEWEAVRSL